MQTKQTDLARLLIGTKVFVVPQFQRHYKWKQAQWLELYEDILDQYEAPDVQAGNPLPNEGHFIGSIVLHPAPGPASTVARYWVIDGQQRLTTLLALIAALRDVRYEVEPTWNPDTYTNQYLRNPFNADQEYRLVPGDNDREDFVSTVYRGEPAGQIGDAYKWYRKQIRLTAASASFDFQKFENAVLLRLIVVEINTSDDDNINQIFNTINHSGMRLSAVDLIRNHSFMQFGSDEATEIYVNIWKPMEDLLGTEARLSQYFWAQLVRRNPKATQRDLYAPFQRALADLQRGSDLDTSAVARKELQRLLSEAPLFLLIVDPLRRPTDWSESLSGAVDDLRAWGSTTHLPITLEVLSRLKRGTLTDADATDALRHLLSFLVRRGLCAIPTNNLNRILSGIPSALDKGHVAHQIASELIRGSKYWPTDGEVLERGMTSPIYHTLQPAQVRFILAEMNDHLLPSEMVRRDELTVEHIMPQTLTEAWREMLTKQEVAIETATAKLHVLGNLTLTGQNSSLGQRAPAEKASMLRNSNLPINRSAALSETWTPSQIDARTQELLELAITIWRRPASESGAPTEVQATLLPESFAIENILDAIPPDTWIAMADLAQLAGTDEAWAVVQVRDAGYQVLPAAQLHAEVDGVAGLTDLDGFDVELATRISTADAVACLQRVGADIGERD